jgi:hypothetical protein
MILCDDFASIHDEYSIQTRGPLYTQWSMYKAIGDTTIDPTN